MRDGPAAANEKGGASETDVEEEVEGRRREAQNFSGGVRSGLQLGITTKWSTNTSGSASMQVPLFVDRLWSRLHIGRLSELLRLRIEYLLLGRKFEG